MDIHRTDVETPHRSGGAYPWVVYTSAVVLSYHDRVVQVLHQDVHVDPVGHRALADVLETCYRTSNTSQTVLEKDVDRVGILADHVTNGHFC